MPSKPEPTEAEAAGARSAMYGLLASALRYPDAALLRTLADADRWSDWPRVIRRLDAECGERLEALRAGLIEPSADGPAGRAAAFQETYARLFGHAVRGACPPYELEYGRAEIIQQSSVLADVAGFYSAFGIELTREGHERPDHVSVECEFMSLLTAKEAHAALDGGGPEARTIVRDAQRSFLEDHLARWLPAFARRLVRADADGFYGSIGGLADAFIRVECRRLDAAAGSSLLELRPVDPERDTAIRCGPETGVPGAGAGGLVQLGLDLSGGAARHANRV